MYRADGLRPDLFSKSFSSLFPNPHYEARKNLARIRLKATLDALQKIAASLGLQVELAPHKQTVSQYISRIKLAVDELHFSYQNEGHSTQVFSYSIIKDFASFLDNYHREAASHCDISTRYHVHWDLEKVISFGCLLEAATTSTAPIEVLKAFGIKIGQVPSIIAWIVFTLTIYNQQYNWVTKNSQNLALLRINAMDRISDSQYGLIGIRPRTSPIQTAICSMTALIRLMDGAIGGYQLGKGDTCTNDGIANAFPSLNTMVLMSGLGATVMLTDFNTTTNLSLENVAAGLWWNHRENDTRFNSASAGEHFPWFWCNRSLPLLNTTFSWGSSLSSLFFLIYPLIDGYVRMIAFQTFCTQFGLPEPANFSKIIFLMTTYSAGHYDLKMSLRAMQLDDPGRLTLQRNAENVFQALETSLLTSDQWETLLPGQQQHLLSHSFSHLQNFIQYEESILQHQHRGLVDPRANSISRLINPPVPYDHSIVEICAFLARSMRDFVFGEYVLESLYLLLNTPRLFFTFGERGFANINKFFSYLVFGTLGILGTGTLYSIGIKNVVFDLFEDFSSNEFLDPCYQSNYKSLLIMSLGLTSGLLFSSGKQHTFRDRAENMGYCWGFAIKPTTMGTTLTNGEQANHEAIMQEATVTPCPEYHSFSDDEQEENNQLEISSNITAARQYYNERYTEVSTSLQQLGIGMVTLGKSIYSLFSNCRKKSRTISVDDEPFISQLPRSPFRNNQRK